jgi:cysteine-rich repeat protein
MRRHQRAIPTIAVVTGALFLLMFGACSNGLHGKQSGVGDAGVGGTSQAESSMGGGATASGGVVAGTGGITQVEGSKVGGATGSGGVAGTGGTRWTESSSVGGGEGIAGTTSGCGVIGCGTAVGGAGGNSGTVILTFGKCGDGIITGVEACDDGDKNNGDGCNSLCQLEANWLCKTPGRPCEDLRICGNSMLTSNETCDDGNSNDGDGCSKDCMRIEPGYECRVPGRRCTPKCGDGVVIGSEQCDDGNSKNGDGCSSTCQVEPDCTDVARPCKAPVCGNGITEQGEDCDCGNGSVTLPAGCTSKNDDLIYGGCTTKCKFGNFCGDGVMSGPEQCDRGKENGVVGASGGCTLGCTRAHFCGDGSLDTDRGEECDLGDLNGQRLDDDWRRSDLPNAYVRCETDCRLAIVLHL